MPKTLLLADDSVTIQKVVAISFASEDIAITTVDNGDDAINRARQAPPDVILADVVMPGKSGYEVCEAIKADPSLRHIPVLLLTGTFEAFDEERAQRAGAAGHVAKPFEAQALVQRVRELLARPPAATPAPATPASPEPASQAPAAAIPEIATPAAVADPDDAFDFFDDEPAPSGDRTQAGGASLEIEPSDSDFSFDDDLSTVGSDPLVGPDLDAVQPAAHTVAILPDTPFDPPVAGGADTVLAMPAESAATADDDLDFEFESVRSGPPPQTRVEGLAEDAVLDPMGDAGFADPAGDDFAPPPPGLEPPEATQILSSPFAESGDDDDYDDSDDDYESEYDEEGIASAESLAPDEDPFDDTEDGLLSPVPIPAEAFPEPNRPLVDRFETPPRSEAYAVEAPPDPEPYRVETPPQGRPPALAFAEPEPDAAPEPVSEPIVEAAPAPTLPDAQATAAAVLEQVAPELRAQLHETLERIAWDAFGQVTDKIVKQAVERVEKAAWEVVPKLAETLILEEIRKLKGE